MKSRRTDRTYLLETVAITRNCSTKVPCVTLIIPCPALSGLNA